MNTATETRLFADKGKRANRAVAVLAAASMVLVAAGVISLSLPVSILAAIAMVAPYGMIVGRALRAAPDTSAPALAIGTGLVIALATAIIIAISGQRSTMYLAYLLSITGVQMAMIVVAVIAFRGNRREKPAWRVLLRGIVDPIVYFGFIFFIFAAAVAHLH